MTFAEWWAQIFDQLDHMDILRAAEQAWTAREEALNPKLRQLKEENKMLRMSLISMDKACEAFPQGKLRTDSVNKWHYNYFYPAAKRLQEILKEIK